MIYRGLCACTLDVVDVCAVYEFWIYCIVMRGAAGARVWEVQVFRHADVVCLCHVCILW